MTIREVLFPTDFSPAARVAGRVAADYARHFGARLHVLHVVPPVTDPTTTPEGLRDAVADLGGGGLTVVTASATGLVARQIAEYARRHRIDLVVMGSHGRTGATRALLGSVIDGVIRRAPCQVLAVPMTPSPGEPAAEAEAAATVATCAVCRKPSHEVICEPCRARIRGESLERKRREERAGL